MLYNWHCCSLCLRLQTNCIARQRLFFADREARLEVSGPTNNSREDGLGQPTTPEMQICKVGDLVPTSIVLKYSSGPACKVDIVGRLTSWWWSLWRPMITFVCILFNLSRQYIQLTLSETKYDVLVVTSRSHLPHERCAVLTASLCQVSLLVVSGAVIAITLSLLAPAHVLHRNDLSSILLERNKSFLRLCT